MILYYKNFILNNQTEDVKVIAKAISELPKKNSQRKRVVVITQGSEPTVLAIGMSYFLLGFHCWGIPTLR